VDDEQRVFENCYQGSVLEEGSERQVLRTHCPYLVIGVGVLRRLVNKDDVGPGGSTEAS
jgi:hypothetical protein